MNESQEKINVAFSISRIFAIVSVASAHITVDNDSSVYYILKTMASIGVIIFMILSGYYYIPDKYGSISKLITKKLKTIVVPWLFMGSLLFLWGVIYGLKNVNLLDWFLYIIGYQSFFYYMTMLVLCYIMFYYKSLVLEIVAVIVSIISVYLTAAGKLEDVVQMLNITNYLNIFNWVGYFAIGCILKRVSTSRLVEFLRNTRWLALAIFVIAFYLLSVFKVDSSYFSYAGLPFHMISTWSIFSISTLEFMDKKWVHTLSNMTFGVYLIHMFVIALCNDIYAQNVILQLLSPIIVTLVSMLLLCIGFKLSAIIKLDKAYCLVTGIRMQRNIKEEK